MPVRRLLLVQGLMIVNIVPVWPMKFMGHPSEYEQRPARDSPTASQDDAASTTKHSDSLLSASKSQPYYDSLFVLAPDASLELTRAFNGLARTRKSCFMNVDYDPRILTEGGCPSGGVYLSQQPPRRDAAEAVRVLAQTLKRGHSEGSSTTTVESSVEQARLTPPTASGASSSSSQATHPANHAVEGSIPSHEKKSTGGGDCRVVLAIRDPRDMLVAHFFAAKHLADVADQTAAAAAASAGASTPSTSTSGSSSISFPPATNASQIAGAAPAANITSPHSSSSSSTAAAKPAAAPKIMEPPKGPPGGLGAARPKRLRGGLAPEAAEAEMQKRVKEAQKWRELGVDAYALAHASAFAGLEERMLVAKHSFEQSGCQVHLSVFEEMVTEPEKWAQKLATFLGISMNSTSTSATDSNGGSGAGMGSLPPISSSSSSGAGSGSGGSRRHSRGGGHAPSSMRALAAAAVDGDASKLATQQQMAAQWQHLTSVAASFRKQVDKEHGHFVGAYVKHLAPTTTEKLAAIRAAASTEAIKLTSGIGKNRQEATSKVNITPSSQSSAVTSQSSLATSPATATAPEASASTTSSATGSALNSNMRRSYTTLHDDAVVSNSRRIGLEAARTSMRSSWRGGGNSNSNSRQSSHSSGYSGSSSSSSSSSRISSGSSNSESWAAYGAIVKQAVASHGSAQKSSVVNKGKLTPRPPAPPGAASASAGADAGLPSFNSPTLTRKADSSPKSDALSRLGPRVPLPQNREPLPRSSLDVSSSSNNKQHSSILGRLGGKNAPPAAAAAAASLRGSGSVDGPQAAGRNNIHPAWGFR